MDNHNSHPVPSGLTGWWDLQQQRVTPGSQELALLEDSSGLENHLSRVGSRPSISWSEQGLPALTNLGTYVMFKSGLSNTLMPSTGWTASILVRRNSTGAASIFGFGGAHPGPGGQQGYFNLGFASTTHAFIVSFGGPSSNTIASFIAPSASWNHIVVTYGGGPMNHASTGLKIWKNGTLQGFSSTEDDLFVPPASSCGLAFGGPVNTTGTWSGSTGSDCNYLEAAIWNRALTSDEVQKVWKYTEHKWLMGGLHIDGIQLTEVLDHNDDGVQIGQLGVIPLAQQDDDGVHIGQLGVVPLAQQDLEKAISIQRVSVGLIAQEEDLPQTVVEKVEASIITSRPFHATSEETVAEVIAALPSPPVWHLDPSLLSGSDGDNVSALTDQSSYSRNLSHGGLVGYPKLKLAGLNGLNCLEWTGSGVAGLQLSGQTFTTWFPSHAQGLSMYFVIKQTARVAAELFSFGSDSNRFRVYPHLSTDDHGFGHSSSVNLNLRRKEAVPETFVWCCSADQRNHLILDGMNVEGYIARGSLTGVSGSRVVYLGAYPTTGTTPNTVWAGLLGEVIFFDGVHTLGQQRRLIAALTAKWSAAGTPPAPEMLEDQVEATFSSTVVTDQVAFGAETYQESVESGMSSTIDTQLTIYEDAPEADSVEVSMTSTIDHSPA